MTAKELKQCAGIYMPCIEIDDEPVLWRYQFKEAELQVFIDQLCLEQREIIHDLICNNEDKDDILVIDNAPMPDL